MDRARARNFIVLVDRPMTSSQPLHTTSRGNAPLVIDLMDHLYPEIIYRFNQSLLSCWKEQELGYINGVKTAYFTCSFFSSHTRTFHWVSVGPGLWNPASGSSAEAQLRLRMSLLDWNSESPKQNTFNTKIDERTAAWKYLLRDLPAGRLYGKAKSDIQTWLRAKRLGPDATQRAILGIYSGYHNKAPVNIEGIFFRLLAKCGNHCRSTKGGLDALLGTLENVGRPNAPAFDWFKPENPCSGCERLPALKTWESIRDPEDSKDETPAGREQEVKPTGSQELLEIFFKHLLAETKASGEQETFGEKLAARRNIALLPIYDVWREGQGFGGIKAIVLTFFGDEEPQNWLMALIRAYRYLLSPWRGKNTAPGAPRDQWLQLNYPRLRSYLPAIATEVAVSAETLAVSQAIEPPYDLLRHFLKVLTFLQDWECASVLDTHCNLILYSYRREAPALGQSKWGWKYAKGGEALTNLPDENISSDGTGNWFMWWTANLWSTDLIPGLGQEEVGRFARFAIRFQFPVACRIPASPDDRKFLRHVYLRQQLSLMRLLIPKVQARRAALRSAVSAIMGRNMSHNIGSHVLARYASEIAGEPEPQEVNGLRLPDIISDFLSYLQRRMDFLAEVATSDQAYWSQALSLSEQLWRLNYQSQPKRFKGATSIEVKYEPTGKWQKSAPVLLSFISGKKRLLASVHYCGDDKLLFACPGGEVGVHALYVILENIIRNSARHGSSDEGTITLEVKAEFLGTGDLIRLEIVDQRSRWKSNGLLHTSADCDRASVDAGALRPCKADKTSENGKRKKSAAVHRNISSILHDEPFLNSDGSPNPLYWGLREMQICAQYLRNLPFSEMEGNQPQPPVLAADSHDDRDGFDCLKYVLYLEPARLAAVMVPKLESIKNREALRRRGVALIAENASLDDIMAQSRGFGFLVHHKNPTISAALLDEKKKAALPVRVLGEIDVGALLSATDTDGWQEILHRRWAENCRDQHSSWQEKPIYGLAVYGDEALKRNPPLNGSDPDKNGAIGWREYGSREVETISTWAKTNISSNGGIGAVWIDHGGLGELETEVTCFGQAGFTKQAFDPLRCWVSAEFARSESPHAKFLNALGARSGWEILAAALPRIAVLDERVQAEANKDLGKRASLHHAWSCMGIWVPEKDSCDLDAPSFDQCHAFLMKPNDLKEQFPIDFLVIHLTVLERLHREKANNAMKETLDQLVSETEAAKAHVVIVTGRGVPSIAQGLNHDDMKHVRYLPISVLLESLTVRPSKLALMRAIWSAGRPQ